MLTFGSGCDENSTVARTMLTLPCPTTSGRRSKYAHIGRHVIAGTLRFSTTHAGGESGLVESYHLSFGLPAVTVRPFNTFGPRQSDRAIIPTIAIARYSRRISETTLMPTNFASM